MYNKYILSQFKRIKQYKIGQEVHTEIGDGVLINIDIPVKDNLIDYKNLTCIVLFNKENSLIERSKFNLLDISPIKKEKKKERTCDTCTTSCFVPNSDKEYYIGCKAHSDLKKKG